MNRAEKERKVQMQDGKVFEINNLTIVKQYLNPNYSLPPLKQDSAILGSTGRLDIFEVRPNSGGGPSFSGRWDGGSRDQGKKDRQDLDIDIERVSRKEQRRFKNGENGYAGHHTKQVASTGARVYEVSIQTPSDGKIFEGTVSFSVHRRMEFKASMTSFDATVEVVKGRGNQAAQVQRKKKTARAIALGPRRMVK